jgi:outer membrane protein TolC
VEIQRRGIELAQRRLENANTLLQQGKNGNRDVLDAQSSLLSAQISYDSARANLQTRILEYMRNTGTLRVDPSAGAIGRAMDRRQRAELSTQGGKQG